MDDIERILKRVKQNGYTYTKSDRKVSSQIAKISNYKVYGNRREKESLIVDPDKIKKLPF